MTRRWLVLGCFVVVQLSLWTGPSRLLLDPDTFWHLATGRSILATLSMPTVDTASHTFAGQRWIAKEWLAQTLMWLSYAMAGWTGVVVLTSTLIASALALLYAWLLRQLKFVTSTTIVIAAYTLASGHYLARPLVFYFPLIVAWMVILLTARRDDRPPPLWAAGLIALWANLHASFPIAFPIAGLLGLEALVRAPAGRRRDVMVGWGRFGVVSLLATGLTPYGFESLLVATVLAQQNEAMQYIDEWRRLDVFSEFGLVATASFAAAVTFLLMRPRDNVFRLAIVLMVAAMMAMHVRFGALFSFVTGTIMGPAIAQAAPGLASRGGRVVESLARKLPALVTALSLAVLSLIAIRLPEPQGINAPSAALAAIRRVTDGPLYNDYGVGGFLIFVGEKTFIDGRSDQLFLGGFISEYYKTRVPGSPAVLLEFLDRHGAKAALLTAGSDAIPAFEALPGWRKLYADDRGVAFVRS
ncbi:hypothetical protein [Alsobacter sp. R-9]